MFLAMTSRLGEDKLQSATSSNVAIEAGGGSPKPPISAEELKRSKRIIMLCLVIQNNDVTLNWHRKMTQV